MMKFKAVTGVFLSLIVLIVFPVQFQWTAQTKAAEGTKLSKGKQTDLGLYVTAREAYGKWQSQPDKIKIIDVRTPEEYALIGHPPMAHNIPFMVFAEKWYAGDKNNGKERPRVMVMNNAFVQQIKKKFTTEDTLILMCRSGGRSAMAVNTLAKAGFKHVFTITDGFEGSMIKDQNNYYYGKRMMNGWKNSGAPWTYKVEADLAFSSVYSD